MTSPDLKDLVSSVECFKGCTEGIGRPVSREGCEGRETWAAEVGNYSQQSTLTVRVALAELLTEILCHDAGAGAVTGAVRVVAGLVVVYLGGGVI